MSCSGRNSSLVAGIGMAGDSDTGIIGENALEPLAHFRSAIGDDHLPGMKRVADADAAAVME